MRHEMSVVKSMLEHKELCQDIHKLMHGLTYDGSIDYNSLNVMIWLNPFLLNYVTILKNGGT